MQVNFKHGRAMLVRVPFASHSALNFLRCMAWTASPSLPETFEPLSCVQESCHRHIFACTLDSAEAANQLHSLADEERFLSSERVSYVGEAVSVRRDLIASKVFAAWRKVGQACVGNIIDHVGEHLAVVRTDPRRFLLPK